MLQDGEFYDWDIDNSNNVRGAGACLKKCDEDKDCVWFKWYRADHEYYNMDCILKSVRPKKNPTIHKFHQAVTQNSDFYMFTKEAARKVVSGKGAVNVC